MLELRDVVKRYRSGGDLVRAIDGVSFTVGAGEFVAMFGPSGSGKTTLLLLASGLLVPDSGQVIFDGRDISDISDSEGAAHRLHNVGFVFQSFHLIGGTTAINNVTVKLLAEGRSVREAREKGRPWLERVGLADRMSHSADHLSMGERQRVAIARALVNEPSVLLADEPTGHLDSVHSAEIMALLRDICHERQVPGLLVTHDAAARRFADRVVTLRDGRLDSASDEDPLPMAAPSP
jgi:putative ABC transport system ATP-binding protein